MLHYGIEPANNNTPFIPLRGEILSEAQIENGNKKSNENTDGENDALPTAVDAKPDLPKKPRGGAKFSFELDARPEWIAENMAQIFKDYVDYRRDMGKAFRSEKQAHDSYDELTHLSGGDPEIAMKIVKKTSSSGWQSYNPFIGGGKNVRNNVTQNNGVINSNKKNFKGW